MMITPHVLVGAALATKISNPFVLVLSSFASHFLIDMIPHKDYDVSPLKRNFYKLVIDAGISAILLFSVIGALPWEKQALFALGGFFGILPDGLWMLHRLFQWKFLERYVNAHQFWHWFLIPEEHTTHPALGWFTNIAVSAAALCILAVYAL